MACMLPVATSTWGRNYVRRNSPILLYGLPCMLWF